MPTDLLQIHRQLAAIAHNGLTFTKDPFDRERYTHLQHLAAELLTAGPNDPLLPRIRQLLAHEPIGYQTPKLDVRAVVYRNFTTPEPCILLVQEKMDDNRWTLPGGWVDIGDSPSTATERECLEETGYAVRAVELLSLWDRDHPRHGHPPIPHHSWKVFFRCEELTPNASPQPLASDIETQSAQFFTETQSLSLDLSETRLTRSQLTFLYARANSASLPAAFD